jgi:hypothetical protein
MPLKGAAVEMQLSVRDILKSPIFKYSLPKVTFFTEEIETNGEQQPNQFFCLRGLSPKKAEYFVYKKKQWIDDSNTLSEGELFQDSKNINEFTELLRECTKGILIFSEIGSGKTCFLYHLFEYYTKKKNILLPLYICSKQLYQNLTFFMHPSNIPDYLQSKTIPRDKQSTVSYILAYTAVQNFEITLTNNSTTETEIRTNLTNLYYNTINEGKAIFLVDNIELLPSNILEIFLLFFSQCGNNKLPEVSRNDDPKSLKSYKEYKEINRMWRVNKAILSVSDFGLQNIPSHCLKSFCASFDLYYLGPGYIFDILSTNQIQLLLKRWPMIERYANIENSAARWNSFESALRYHRKKLYPDDVQSPTLLFLLARRLAKGSGDDNEPSDKEFSLFKLIDDLFDDCLTFQYQKLCDSNENKQQLLVDYNLDMAALKKLCSFVGFLCHYFHPTAIVNITKKQSKVKPDDEAINVPLHNLDEEENKDERDFLPQMSHIEFIEYQFKHLLQQSIIPPLMGIHLRGANGPSGNFYTYQPIFLSKEEIAKLVSEIVELISPFYKCTEDGYLKPLHPCLQDYLAAFFLAENSYYSNTILRFLVTTIDVPRLYFGCYYTLEFRTFDLSSSFILTSWRWDGVIQFIGIKNGVVKLAENFFQYLAPSSHESSPFNQAVTKSDTPFTGVFDTWLKRLRLGYDPDDLGQIKIQILLRVYSTICNHRPSYQTFSDPLTEAFSTLFLRLLEQSSTVLIHLETFPNYFLSCFSPSVAHLIIKKCMNIFISHSTNYSGNIISKFRSSPYLHSHLTELITPSFLSSSPPSAKLAIFSIIHQVDDKSLEKHYISQVFQLLNDDNCIIQREIINNLANLGMKSAEQISFTELSSLFDDYNGILVVISSAIKRLSQLLRSQKSPNKKTELKVRSVNMSLYIKKPSNPQSQTKDQEPLPFILTDQPITNPSQEKIKKYFEDGLSMITALLEQSDPGARLLAYYTLGSPDYNMEHDDLINGALARKAALYLISCLQKLLTTSPIFSQSSSIEEETEDQFDYLQSFLHFKKRLYSFTVVINSIISSVFGEIASCWVSSITPLLKYKQNLFIRANARSFKLLNNMTRQLVLCDLLLHETQLPAHNSNIFILIKNRNDSKDNINLESKVFSLYSLVEYQALLSLLLLNVEDLKECTNIIHLYLEQIFFYRRINDDSNPSLPGSFEDFILQLKLIALQCYKKVLFYTIPYSPFTLFERILEISLLKDSPQFVPIILSMIEAFVIAFKENQASSIVDTQNEKSSSGNNHNLEGNQNSSDLTSSSDDVLTIRFVPSPSILESISNADVHSLFKIIEKYYDTNYYLLTSVVLSFLPYIPSSKLQNFFIENTKYVNLILRLMIHDNSTLRQSTISMVGTCCALFNTLNKVATFYPTILENFHSLSPISRASSVSVIISTVNNADQPLREVIVKLLLAAFSRYSAVLFPPKSSTPFISLTPFSSSHNSSHSIPQAPPPPPKQSLNDNHPQSPSKFKISSLYNYFTPQIIKSSSSSLNPSKNTNNNTRSTTRGDDDDDIPVEESFPDDLVVEDLPLVFTPPVSSNPNSSSSSSSNSSSRSTPATQVAPLKSAVSGPVKATRPVNDDETDTLEVLPMEVFTRVDAQQKFQSSYTKPTSKPTSTLPSPFISSKSTSPTTTTFTPLSFSSKPSTTTALGNNSSSLPPKTQSLISVTTTTTDNNTEKKGEKVQFSIKDEKKNSDTNSNNNNEKTNTIVDKKSDMKAPAFTKREATWGIVSILSIYRDLMSFAEFFRTFYENRTKFLPLLSSNIKIIQITSIYAFSHSFYYSKTMNSNFWSSQTKKDIFLSILLNNCNEDEEIRCAAQNALLKLKIYFDDEITSFPPQIITILTNLIESKKDRDREVAIDLFQFFGISLIRLKGNFFIQLLLDPSDPVRLSAIRGLKSLLSKHLLLFATKSTTRRPPPPSSVAVDRHSSSAPMFDLKSLSTPLVSSSHNDNSSSDVSSIMSSDIQTSLMSGWQKFFDVLTISTINNNSNLSHIDGSMKDEWEKVNHLFSLFSSTVIKLLSDKNPKIQREALNFLALLSPISEETIQSATQILCRQVDSLKPRVAALLLLSSANQLTDQLTANLFDLIYRSVKELHVDIFPYLMQAGYPFARLIPKIISYFDEKVDQSASIKRKLIAILENQQVRLSDDYQEMHPSITAMVSDSDTIVRSKAADIIVLFTRKFKQIIKQTNDEKISDEIMGILKRFTEVLVAKSSDGNSMVRKKIVNSLSEIGEEFPKFQELILNLMFSGDTEPSISILLWKLFSYRWGIFIKKPQRSYI